jgi:peptide/nickel transport system substrate-binding protein
VLLVVLGCVSPTSRPSQDGTGGTSSRGTIKTLTIAGGLANLGFAVWNASNAGHLHSVENVHSLGLVNVDEYGNLEGRLATTIPSLDDHTITVLPDGRMQTTWKLRPDVVWHDGTRFTADDLVFTWDMMNTPGVPVFTAASVRAMEKMEAPDPLSLVITYKTTYYQAATLVLQDFWPAPRHILGEGLQGDLESFLNHPYWTTEYIHTGPFRLVDYGLGENIVFERFDNYFLGRPKLDRVIFQAIPDPNTLFANIRAGTVDMATELSLPPDLLVQLRDEWKRSGGGSVLSRQGALRYFKVQFDPEWSKLPEMSRDPRVRQALYMGIDRDALRDALFPGFEDTEADTYMLKNDPRAAVVGKPFAEYPFDVARGVQALSGTTFGRVSDGRILNASGEQVQVPVRGDRAFFKEVQIAADGWRRMGFDVAEEVQSPELAGRADYRAQFPGLTTLARGTGDAIFVNFDSRSIPRVQNRFAGQNAGAYANPAFDRVLDRLYVSLDQQEQGQLLKEAGEILAADLPLLPLYFRVELTAVVQSVHALTDDYSSATSRTIARRAHLWDRD